VNVLASLSFVGWLALAFAIAAALTYVAKVVRKDEDADAWALAIGIDVALLAWMVTP
jgi:methylmalonyl-CoA mutase N-terminal domain/subunit